MTRLNLNNMKDYVNQEIKVGDICVGTAYHYRELRIFKVIELLPKTEKVQIIMNEDHSERLIMPKQLCVIPKDSSEYMCKNAKVKHV